MASTQLPTYERFTVLSPKEEGALYSFPSYVDGNNTPGVSHTISVYRVRSVGMGCSWSLVTHTLLQGVSAGLTSGNVADDGYRYVYLGKDNDDQYMREEDFKNRFNDQVLQADFAKVQGGDTMLFPVWTSDGQPASLERKYVLDVKKGETAQAWAARMKASWTSIYQSAAKSTAPFDVYAHFFQPASFAGFELVFTPSEDEELISQAELAAYVAAVMTGDDMPKYAYRVLSFKAAQDEGLVLLSSSFYGFYHTWICSANFEEVFKARLGSDPIARPWPADIAAALAVDQKVKKAGEAGDGLETSMLVTTDKIQMGSGMRRLAASQETAMGDVSATEVCFIFCQSSRGSP